MTSIRLICAGALIATVGCGSQPQPKPTLTESTRPPQNTELSSHAQTDLVAAETEMPPPAAKIEKIEAKHLPNPVRVHAKVISGGMPEGDEAFAELKSLGIVTVISVDGAKPDVATAEKYGMRYVHLPHGYDGVPENRVKELAKAVRNLPGPIYIHCHHGKHRSPAAAAVACVAAGLIDHAHGSSVLRIAGTSDAYRGLFQSVESAKPLDQAVLDSLDAEFPTVAKLPALAEAMVAIEHVHDHLKAIEKAGWTTPADKPALVPAHEALLLREHYTELLRTKEVQQKPEKFQSLARDAETACQALEDALKASTDAEAASKLFATVTSNCKACHQAFRDVPLQQKSSRKE